MILNASLINRRAVEWLARPPSPDSDVRLFCFPYAGGGVSVFRLWPLVLEPSVDVLPIQLPGRDRRLLESSPRRLNALAPVLTEALVPFLDRPFAFFGHSLGALVAFEVSRRLQAIGAPAPVHLFVSAYRAPQIPRHGKVLHFLSDDDLVEELRQLQGTPDAVLRNSELMQLLLPAIRSDFEMHETYTYVPGMPLDCPISAFGGHDDDHVTHEDLEAWRLQTTHNFTVRMLPGDHFFLHASQDHLLRFVSADLQDLHGQIARCPEIAYTRGHG